VEHAMVRPTDLSKLNRAFFDLNGYVSVAFLICVGVDQLLR
jgi:4-hydroxybenzoate polyprenyltransferase